jgi:prepilin-type processing-associated H-X9-DG protein
METELTVAAKKPWMFLWSRISLWSAISAWVFLLLLIPAGLLVGAAGERSKLEFDGLAIFLPLILLSLIGITFAFATGILSLCGFLYHKTKIDNKEITFGGIWLSLLYLLMMFLFFPSVKKAKDMGPGYGINICHPSVRQLYLACNSYHDETGAWPTKSSWSSQIEKIVGNAELFRCPLDLTGPCSYAMNANIPDGASDLPPDLVLLFESAPGWNRTGGPADVVTDRHGKHRPGANIAFADGRVELISAKNIPALRWTVEKGTKRAVEKNSAGVQRE